MYRIDNIYLKLKALSLRQIAKRGIFGIFLILGAQAILLISVERYAQQLCRRTISRLKKQTDVAERLMREAILREEKAQLTHEIEVTKNRINPPVSREAYELFDLIAQKSGAKIELYQQQKENKKNEYLKTVHLFKLSGTTPVIRTFLTLCSTELPATVRWKEFTVQEKEQQKCTLQIICALNRPASKKENPST
jgi:hypothetical protein